MPGYADPGFDTLALYAGSAPDPSTGAHVTPLHLSAGFVFDNSADAAGLFNAERSGHLYSRISNPTTAVFEERMAALEGGVAAVATSSGQAALWLALVTLCGAGSHIVASSALFAGARHLLTHALPRLGISTTFVPPADEQAWRDAIRPETRLLFGETLGNPSMVVLDIPNISALAREAGLPLLVDASMVTPYLQRPIALGADLVMHSATRFLCGHGTVLGGVLVDGGRFDWQRAHAQSGRFATLCEPYDGFHGVVFAEESTVGAFSMRARHEGLRDFGACMSPHSAWLLLQGIETLSLRMARHVSNAQTVAEWLAVQPEVRSVGYPGLSSHPSHALAQQLLPKGPGAVFSFELDGSRAQGQRFLESLKLFNHLSNVGDARSLVIHPASTTHSRLSEEALKAAGIGEGTIRLSIGLEEPDDLIADLKAAIKGTFR